MVSLPSIARRAGNSAWVAREKNLGERERDELATLFGEPWSALADATGFMSRFETLISQQTNRHLWASTTIEYLTTEGRAIDADVEGDGTSLNVRHLLYWLDVLLKRNKTSAGNGGSLDYADRLSEMVGWGSAAPDNHDDSDPLGLHDLLDGLDIHHVHIDNDAVDDADAGSLGGCVIPTYRGGSAHPCTTIGGLAKSNNGSGGLFSTTAELQYKYDFWYSLDGLHEGGGSTSTRFPKGGGEVFVLVRWATDHQISREIVLTKTDDTAQQCARITIMGYPGELPKIRMGSSTTAAADGANGAQGNLRDTSPVANEIGAVSGSVRPTMIAIGDAKPRTNVHFRNLWFVGNRAQNGGSGQIFAARTLYFTSTATGCSVRYCKFTETQFIRDDDPIVGSDGLRDAVWGERSSGDMQNSAGVLVSADDFVFDSNEVIPVAKAAWPGNDIANYGTYDSPWLNVFADNVRVTRNTFSGAKSNSMVRFGDSDTATDGAYVADNHIEVWDKVCIDFFNSTNFTVERNRLHDFGNVDYQLEGGGVGVQVTYSTDGTIRDNVIFNHEDAVAGALGIALNNNSDNETNTARITVQGNILYRCGLRFDNNNFGTITDCDISRNVIAGMTEARKATAHTNAPLNVEMTLSLGTLEGNLIYDNQIWRFDDATPDQATIESGPHLAIRKTGGQNTYAVTDTLTGWTGNTATKPAWLGDPETPSDDLRLTSDLISADAPFTTALSRAWTAD